MRNIKGIERIESIELAIDEKINDEEEKKHTYTHTIMSSVFFVSYLVGLEK